MGMGQNARISVKTRKVIVKDCQRWGPASNRYLGFWHLNELHWRFLFWFMTKQQQAESRVDTHRSLASHQWSETIQSGSKYSQNMPKVVQKLYQKVGQMSKMVYLFRWLRCFMLMF